MCSSFFPPRAMKGPSWPKEWAFLEEVLEDFRGVIMVIAPSDRGKTTLVRCLASALLRKGKRVGWVDTDLGQSQIGPPTTVGGLVLLSEVELRERLFTPLFRFFGDTTPERDVIALTCYAWDLVRCVKRQSDVVLLDTCGLFHSPSGYLLKMLKIRFIQPEIVLALGEKEEFAPFVSFLKERLLVLPVPCEVSEKGYGIRREHRQRLFALYFSAGREMSFPLTALRFSLPCYPSFFLWKAIQGKDEMRFESLGEEVLLVPDGASRESTPSRTFSSTFLEGFLCGLFSRDGRDLGLGIIERISWEERVLMLWGVQCVSGKIEAVVPGAIRITREGEERGRFGIYLSPLRLEKRTCRVPDFWNRAV